MIKTELINALSIKTNSSKKSAETFVNAFIDVIATELKSNGKVHLTGFGTFETRKRASRKAINFRTKEQIIIPESIAPVFKAGKALKEIVNK